MRKIGLIVCVIFSVLIYASPKARAAVDTAAPLFKPTSATIVYSQPKEGAERVPFTFADPYIHGAKEVNDQWMSIPIGDGRLGYIKTMYVNKVSEEEKRLLFDPKQFDLPVKGQTAIYRSPSGKSEVIDKLPAGAVVTVVAHDPKTQWVRIRLGESPETYRPGYIEKKRLDISGGRKMAATETFTSSDYWTDPTPASGSRVAGRPLTTTEKILCDILLYSMLLIPIVYRLFRSKFNGREQLFVGLTVVAAVINFVYNSVLIYVFHASGEMETSPDIFDFKDLLFKLVLFLVSAGALYCGLPLLAWARERIKTVYPQRGRFAPSNLPQAIISLIFGVTMLFVALQAASLLLYLALALAILAILGYVAFRIVSRQAINWGKGGSRSTNGIPGTCGSCRYYMHSSCVNTGTPTGSGDSCGSYSPV